MKTFKILTVAVLAATAIVSSAYAGGDQRQRQIGEENADYFYHMNQGRPSSGQAVVENADYKFASRPEQRMAQRNQEYFQKIGYKGGEVKPFNYYTDVSQYPFPGSVMSPERGGYVFSSAVKR